MSVKRWQLTAKDSEIEKLRAALSEAQATLEFYVEVFDHQPRHGKRAKQMVTKIKETLSRVP